MADRPPEDNAAPRPEPLRWLGDPELGATLRDALRALLPRLDAAGEVAGVGDLATWRPQGSTPLDLYTARRRDPAGAARAAARSVGEGRALLRVEMAWGRAVVGPLTRPGCADACAACAGVATDEDPAPGAAMPERAASSTSSPALVAATSRGSAVEARGDTAIPAELALLPGLVAAIVASELVRWRDGVAPAAVDGELHVVPYRSWAAATRPILVREALVRRPSCSFCGVPTPATTARVRRVVAAVFAAPLRHPARGGGRPSSRGIATGRHRGDEAWT